MNRVFVNAIAVEVPPGSSALDAVRAFDAATADEVTAGTRVITDSRGLPIAADAPTVAGSIFRILRRRAGQADAEDER